MITYFHRNLNAGYSINKVIQTIVRSIDDKQEYFVPYMGGGPSVILRNICYVRKRRSLHGINHITGDILYCVIGLIGCKSILTIHDTVILDFQKNSWKGAMRKELGFCHAKTFRQGKGVLRQRETVFQKKEGKWRRHFYVNYLNLLTRK